MKVHLIQTDEYDEDSLIEVCDLLTSFKGPIKFFTPSSDNFCRTFCFAEDIPEMKYDKDGKTFEEDEEVMTWEELFSICSEYRADHNIDKDDFVILLTTIKNEHNWFSHTDEHRNVFVHTGNWHLYTKAHDKYPIAYQIMENILQSFMEPNFHSKPIGCMNDFCQDKEEIMWKLRTADICPSCFEKLNANVSNNIITQALNTFDGIRKQVLFRKSEKKQPRPVPIILNAQKQLLLPELGNLEIKLNPLFKTLYLFYLKHNEGVRLNQLSDFKEELLSIYKHLSIAGDRLTIENRINDLVSAQGDSFNQKKAKINRIVNDLLGESLAQFYRIEGARDEPYKINLPVDLVDIRY